MNIGIVLLGVVGGAIVGFGLEFQERSRSRRWNTLTTDGVRATGTITEVTSTGRYATMRRCTVTVDGGGSFVQTFDMMEADRLGIVAGQRVGLWHRIGDPTDATLDLANPHSGRSSVPLIAGVVIAVLGVAAGVVV